MISFVLGLFSSVRSIALIGAIVGAIGGLVYLTNLGQRLEHWRNRAHQSEAVVEAVEIAARKVNEAKDTAQEKGVDAALDEEGWLRLVPAKSAAPKTTPPAPEPARFVSRAPPAKKARRRAKRPQPKARRPPVTYVGTPREYRPPEPPMVWPGDPCIWWACGRLK